MKWWGVYMARLACRIFGFVMPWILLVKGLIASTYGAQRKEGQRKEVVSNGNLKSRGRFQRLLIVKKSKWFKG
jgi:hypothetical protein